MKTSRKSRHPHIAHQIPGRIRIKLPRELNTDEKKTLLQDLKMSPRIQSARFYGRSLIIEHGNGDNADALSHATNALSQHFPGFVNWSNELDERAAKVASDPWINKTLPLGVLGLAAWALIRDGALFAGESAFALAYLAFDLYWKFEQENVIRKIEQGLSKKDKEKVESAEHKAA